MTILFLFLTGCESEPQWSDYNNQNVLVYPDTHWVKVSNPQEIGWSTEYLVKARTFSEKIGSTALMIIHKGVVIDAWGEITTKSKLHSIRKSLLSGLIGIAVDRAQINLSDTLSDLNIDDNEPSLTDIEKSATVGDLIKARSGIYHAALYETTEMTKSKPKRGSQTPGSYWHYNNWDFNALGTIYEQQTGQSIFQAFKHEFAEPLQMEDYEVADGEYITGDKSIHSAYPFWMSARDLGRFALLYLRSGRWKNQQILSQTWIKQSTTAYSQVGHSGYGYMWWTGEKDDLFPYLYVREHSYYAAGWGGQYAIVFPYLDLIVIHRVNTNWWRYGYKYLSKEHLSRDSMGKLLKIIFTAMGEKNPNARVFN